MKRTAFVNGFFIIGLLILSIGCQQSAQVKTGLEGKKMPSFDLMLMDSVTKFNTNKFPEGKPVVLFYFRPDCPYCKAQIEDIVKHIQSLEGIEICLVTAAPFGQTKAYYKQYEIEKYKNMIGTYDYGNFFYEYFKASFVPYMAIYDNSKRLKQVILGTIKIDEIKSIIKS